MPFLMSLTLFDTQPARQISKGRRTGLFIFFPSLGITSYYHVTFVTGQREYLNKDLRYHGGQYRILTLVPRQDLSWG